MKILGVELGDAGGGTVPKLVRRQTHAKACHGSPRDHVGKHIRRELSATASKPHGRAGAPPFLTEFIGPRAKAIDAEPMAGRQFDFIDMGLMIAIEGEVYFKRLCSVPWERTGADEFGL